MSIRMPLREILLFATSLWLASYIVAVKPKRIEHCMHVHASIIKPGAIYDHWLCAMYAHGVALSSGLYTQHNNTLYFRRLQELESWKGNTIQGHPCHLRVSNVIIETATLKTAFCSCAISGATQSVPQIL